MKHNFSSSIQSSLDGRSSPEHSEPKQEKPRSETKKSSKPSEASVVKRPEAKPPAAPEEQKPKKHPGGRPTKKSKGEEKRKKYSLTLLEATYAETLSLANSEGISFSKYVERAIEEYKKNH